MNPYNNTSILTSWSWTNKVGPYQYYIHGSEPISSYIALSESYKNPADAGSLRGLQLSIDNTSSWNGQNMMRTELIPQTAAAINASKVFYHFSISHGTSNPPSMEREHQISFFESHFTELKFGLSGSQLQWFANSEPHYNMSFEAGEWHNIAYEIDFEGGNVGLWHSKNGEELEMVAGPVDVEAKSDGMDWHLGVLRLPSNTGGDDSLREDWWFSGVYVEKGEIAKSVSGLGGEGNSSCESS